MVYLCKCVHYLQIYNADKILYLLHISTTTLHVRLSSAGGHVSKMRGVHYPCALPI